jgi:putative phosphoesterase
MSVNIFVTGDLHIPSRSTILHPIFHEILKQEKWNYIVLTGDLTAIEVFVWFKQFLSPKGKIIAFKGNMDSFQLPLKPVFTINNTNFGVYHGTGIYPRGNVTQLKEIAKQMKVDVLFTGHSHQTLVHKDDEHIILNPGTGTGASGGDSWTVDTAIMTLEFSPSTKDLVLNWYKLNRKGNLTNEKIDLLTSKKKIS